MPVTAGSCRFFGRTGGSYRQLPAARPGPEWPLPAAIGSGFLQGFLSLANVKASVQASVRTARPRDPKDQRTKGPKDQKTIVHSLTAGRLEACKRAERAQEAEPQWAWCRRKRTGKRACKGSWVAVLALLKNVLALVASIEQMINCAGLFDA